MVAAAKEYGRSAMRRFSVSLTVLVLLAGIVTMGTNATAQPVTPAASPVAVSPLVQAWLNAYSSQDSDAFAALYTPDGIYEDVPSGQAAQGHEAIAELVAGYFKYPPPLDQRLLGSRNPHHQEVVP